ncbi:MAG: hypothetical protein ACR2HH_09865 [Chthoniobacterales bacterium]
MFPRPLLVWLMSAVFAFAGEAAAALYDNGPPNQRNGFEMTHWQQADDFKLNAAARIESVKIWTFEGAGSFQGSILWQLYANAPNDTPGALLASGFSSNLTRTLTGASLAGYLEYVMTFQITPVTLPAGMYWLSLHNGPLSNNSESGRVYWETTENLGATPSRGLVAPFDGTWFSHAIPVGSNAEIAFQLNGVTAPSLPALVMNATGPSVSFTTLAGQTYRLDYKDRLTDATWGSVIGAAEIPGNGNAVTINDTDPITHEGHRFYRARLCPCQTLIGPALTAFSIGRTPQIKFTTAFGQLYRVEYKNEVFEANWTPLPGAENIPGTGQVIQIKDNDPGARGRSRRFYRAVVLDSDS